MIFLSVKNDVNVPTKRNKQKHRITDEKEPDKDPLVRSTDPRIRIRPKMSRIRNTVNNRKYADC